MAFSVLRGAQLGVVPCIDGIIIAQRFVNDGTNMRCCLHQHCSASRTSSNTLRFVQAPSQSAFAFARACGARGARPAVSKPAAAATLRHASLWSCGSRCWLDEPPAPGSWGLGMLRQREDAPADPARFTRRRRSRRVVVVAERYAASELTTAVMRSAASHADASAWSSPPRLRDSDAAQMVNEASMRPRSPGCRQRGAAA